MSIFDELDRLFSTTQYNSQYISTFNNYIRSLTYKNNIYELYECGNNYKIDAHYYSKNEYSIYGGNKVLIIFPQEAIVLLCSMSIAKELSGILLYITYSNPTNYPIKQYHLYNDELNTTVLSPTIIVTDLPTRSITVPIYSESENNSEESFNSVYSLIYNS